MAVLGSIEQYCRSRRTRSPAWSTAPSCRRSCEACAALRRSGRRGLTDGVRSPGAQRCRAYESRVLQGIWAAAPYLHNGSVPTLAQLLTPAAQRVASFKVGPNYDTVNIGLAAKQTSSTSLSRPAAPT